jgi:secretion/DNA translocation related CpaE-like protein
MPVRVLLVTADDDVGASVTRLVSLAGGQVETLRSLHDPPALRAAWSAAPPLVVVGRDVVSAVSAAGLPRRGGVVVVGFGSPDVAQWRASVELGAAQVVELPAGERLLVDLISAAGEPVATGRLIAVLGGCGGAGASTFAAALAIAAGAGGEPALVDADPFGGGLDVLLGAERRPGLRWTDLAETSGRLDAAALSRALCRVAGIAVLPTARDDAVRIPPAAAAAVLDATRRAFPLVVVDLARQPDETSHRIVSDADAVVLIVPATVRAVAAAATLTSVVAAAQPRIGLVVRDPGRERLAARDVGAGLGHPVITCMRSEGAVAAAALRGDPPLGRHRGSLAEACTAVLAAWPDDRGAG